MDALVMDAPSLLQASSMEPNVPDRYEPILTPMNRIGNVASVLKEDESASDLNSAVSSPPQPPQVSVSEQAPEHELTQSSPASGALASPQNSRLSARNVAALAPDPKDRKIGHLRRTESTVSMQANVPMTPRDQLASLQQVSDAELAAQAARGQINKSERELEMEREERELEAQHDLNRDYNGIDDKQLNRIGSSATSTNENIRRSALITRADDSNDATHGADGAHGANEAIADIGDNTARAVANGNGAGTGAESAQRGFRSFRFRAGTEDGSGGPVDVSQNSMHNIFKQGHHEKHRPARAKTMVQNELIDATDVVAQFIRKKFPHGVMTSSMDLSEDLTVESLLKKAHLLHNRASSYVNDAISHNIAIESFRDCLQTIYMIYQVNGSLDGMTSNKGVQTTAVSLHMNCVLNLAGLYSMDDQQLDEAIKLYEEAMMLYETDPNGFNNSQVNLKAWMLRGMADIYIKQHNIKKALETLDNALLLAYDAKDSQTEYYALCSQARALLEAKDLERALPKFNKAINKGRILHNSNQMPYSGMDRDLYRNAALCNVKMAHKHCNRYKENNVSYVKNTQKSIQFYAEATKMYYEALKITSTLFGNKHLEYCKSLFDFAECRAQRGQFAQAYKILEKIEKLFGEFDDYLKEEEAQFSENVQKMIRILTPLMKGTGGASNEA